MPFVFCMFVNVFLGKAAKEDAVEAGMKSVQVGAAHVTDTRFCHCRPSSIFLKHLSFPGFGSPAPNKALVYDSQILFPIIHLIAIHMGAPGRTHDRNNIHFIVYIIKRLVRIIQNGFLFKGAASRNPRCLRFQINPFLN